MNKKIVFINQSAGYLMVDIINQYATQYDECILITGHLNPRNNPLNEKVKVDKIISYKRSTNLQRLFTWAYGTIQVFFKLLFRYRQADLFIVSNPPFAPGLPLLLSNPFSLLIYDIYPDALIEYKVFKENSYLVKIWKWVNHKVFAKAKTIFTISESMKERLEKYNPNQTLVKVIPVWTDNSFFQPVPKKDNPFLKEHGLENKFIVLYSGNLGYTHDVEVIVDLAIQMSQSELFFLIIGEGNKKQLLQEKIATHQLQNCRLLPWQDTKVLPYSLSAADIAIVTLGREASKLSVPSKTFNFMSVGAPILSIADPSSELSQLIEKHSIGANFKADEIEAMQGFIDQLLKDTAYHNQLKINARKAARAYGPDNARHFLECTSPLQCHDL